MVTPKTQKVKRNAGDETIEDVVVKELDLEKLGSAVSDERISRKVTSTQSKFDSVYEGQKAGIYDLDKIAMKDAPSGTKIYEIKGINNQLQAENAADQLGVFLAKKHHRSLANRMETLKKKIEDENFDEKKDETEASIIEELQTARNELQKLGFNWQEVYQHLISDGLDNQLRDSIKESYGKHAPSFEASRYLSQITDAHKPLVVDHLKGKHKQFVKYKLGDLNSDELKSIFAQTHSLYDRHKDAENVDLLQKDMHTQFKRLYRSNAAEPELGKPKEYVSPKGGSKNIAFPKKQYSKAA